MAINFPIVTTFDDKATKKADKAFGALGKKFAAAFSVAAVVKFGKASVKAFSDSQKEAALLATQLNAVNLGFASPLLNDFIDKLELTSGLAGKDLTNAFISLSQATGDVTTAQNILSTALDVSLGTGKSLQTVSNALQRAYKGETTALARLRIGYTTAELKGKKFDDVLEDLQNKFSGAAARATDTFAGKMARLSASVEQAQEAFGEGLVSGIEKSDMSIEELQESIIGLGQALGDLTAGVITFSNTTIDKFEDIQKSSAVQGVLNIFEALVRGVGFVVTGELVPTMDQTSARLAAEERRKNEVSNRATLRNRNQLLKSEQKINNAKKEQNKLSDKEKQNALALAKAKSVFDLEKIQIEAALQGKITEEERVRLQLMKAIANENVDRVNELTEKLKQLQSDTEKLAKSLTNFPEANDPFVMWTKTLTTVTDQLKAIATKKIVVDFLANFTPTGTAAITGVTGGGSASSAAITAAASPGAAAAAAAAQAEIDLLLGDAEAARAAAAAARAEAEAARIAAEAAIAAARTEADRIIAEEAARAAQAAADAAEAIEESAAALDAAAAANAAAAAAIEASTSQNIAEMLAAEAAANDAAAALLESSFLFEESIVSAMAAGVPTTEIYVNVEGSVTAVEDLAEVITDIQYNYQRTGKGLLLQSRAI